MYHIMDDVVLVTDIGVKMQTIVNVTYSATQAYCIGLGQTKSLVLTVGKMEK